MRTADQVQYYTLGIGLLASQSGQLIPAPKLQQATCPHAACLPSMYSAVLKELHVKSVTFLS